MMKVEHKVSLVNDHGTVAVEEFTVGRLTISITERASGQPGDDGPQPRAVVSITREDWLELVLAVGAAFKFNIRSA